MHGELELLQGDPLDVAPRVLGALVHCRGVTVRLTEVEAYRGEDDPGSHAFRGETPRTSPMFAGAGHVYAYFTYGMHTCVNLVCGPAGRAGALLLRAGEVVAGAEAALERRRGGRPERSIPHRDLARGPARLAQALGVTLADSGSLLAPVDDIEADGLRLEPRPAAAPALVARGPRVGVAGPGGGAEYPWRFWLEGEPTVSVYRAAVRRRAAGPQSSGSQSSGPQSSGQRSGPRRAAG
ncbi:DNA-3-methyladenine glycosylase [Microcella pacifica]|mgnify:FL=1|uniref:DNA-3-methyladenine glycosylase n=1 Tax=Microcella pacifica TaxID=2591847 RepID=UPI002E2B483C|nr:DNA-3-methyladenine glycosylase [Microcella pacifica]